ncbi:MAG: hypothetical protein ACRDIU_07485 [Actinomycetota bacterium]
MAEVDQVKTHNDQAASEEVNRGNPAYDSKVSLVMMLGRAASFGLIAALVGLGWHGGAEAAGAFGGAAAAGIYATGYLNSHLSRARRERLWDAGLALTALVRFAALSGGGVAAYLAGRTVLIAYLSSFAAIFALLVAFEIARVAAVFKARGEVGIR